MFWKLAQFVIYTTNWGGGGAQGMCLYAGHEIEWYNREGESDTCLSMPFMDTSLSFCVLCSAKKYNSSENAKGTEIKPGSALGELYKRLFVRFEQKLLRRAG